MLCEHDNNIWCPIFADSCNSYSVLVLAMKEWDFLLWLCGETDYITENQKNKYIYIYIESNRNFICFHYPICKSKAIFGN